MKSFAIKINNDLENSKFIMKKYFQQLTHNLKIAGIMIHGNFEKKFYYFVYSAFLLTIFVYIFTITEFIHICKVSDDMENLLFTLSYFIAHCIGVAKVTLFLLKRKEINNFLQTLEKEQFLPNIHRGGLQEFTLVEQAVSRLKTQMNIFWVIVIVMLSNRMVWIVKHPTAQYFSADNTNVTITIRQFPYANSYPIEFDNQKSPYYEFVFIHQVVSVWIIGWYMGNADGITNGLMIHLTSQFKIVANAFTNVTELTKKLINKNSRKMENNKKLTYKTKFNETVVIDKIQAYDQEVLYHLKRCIIKCIKHHQETLKLADDMEKTLNPMLLIQFAGCLSLYAIQLYQLSLLPLLSTSFLSMTCFMFAMIFQVLIYCWNGNEMSITSEDIAEAVFTCNWIPADKATKDLLLMTIMRAKRPVFITAGKFSKLSLTTFAAILRGSFSYFTVLHNVNDVEQ